MPDRDPLSALFQALADPTRRGLVERLVVGPASVKQLAGPVAMSLPSVMQHLGVLEASGLVRSEKAGRVRTYQLTPAALRAGEAWLAAQRTTWERRFDRLDAVLGAAPDTPPEEESR